MSSCELLEANVRETYGSLHKMYPNTVVHTFTTQLPVDLGSDISDMFISSSLFKHPFSITFSYLATTPKDANT